MLQNVVERCSEQRRNWSLKGLENIFHFALEQKSKCLIQACIFIVEQDFLGVSSFSHRTQVKFLLESIRHIIADNCQEEFIHIMQYLKLLHALCIDVGCEEEYVNSVLRIKQSFVLFTLLDNESAANVCQVMNDFFPKHDPLESFNITKGSLKKRFLTLVKRQILGFRRLVAKLLTDMEFRSYYFYDEWMEEFGPSFHKEMISDIDKYLRQIESCLLVGRKTDQISRNWLEINEITNPVMLYFLKLLIDRDIKNSASENRQVEEFKYLQLLQWMFPSLDFAILTMPCTNSLKVPEVFNGLKFNKIYRQAGWTLDERRPWEYDTFLSCVSERFKKIKDEEEDLTLNETRLKWDGSATTAFKRIPLATLTENTICNRTNIRTKRKRNDQENQGNYNSKRARTDPKIIGQKSLVVDLCKKNVFMRKTGDFMKLSDNENTDSNTAIKISVDSPQCKRLLESGSKFFSSTRQDGRTVQDVRTPIVSEISTEAVEFSDEENDSDQLNAVEDTMSTGLTWISTTKHNKSAIKSSNFKCKRTCRSLYFKSESSDEHVSESEPEFSTAFQPTVRLQDCIKMLDQTLFPDLTFHIKKLPDTKPCTVQLENPSELIIKTKKNEILFEGCKVVNKEDILILKNVRTEFRFRNYSLH